jgi:DnaJ family protein C protein 7
MLAQDIGEAYGVLEDEKLRQRYDQGVDIEDLERGGGGGGGGMGGHGGIDPNVLFSHFFGGGGGGRGGGMHFG